MTRARAVAGPLALWLVVMVAAGLFVARGQASEREALLDRFHNRAETGSGFVASYVDDVFETEQRLADRMSQDGWDPSAFSTDAAFLGFPAAVLLDREGRAVSLVPDAPELHGSDLAGKYAHLQAALDGTRTVSDVVPSAVEGTPVVAFAMPVDSDRYAVLSGAFSLSESPLATFLQRQPIPGTRGALIDSKGDVIVASGDSTLGQRLLPRLRDAPGEPVVTDGRVVVAGPVAGTGWSYVLDAPRRTLLAPAAANNTSEWVLLSVVGLLALAGIAVTQGAKAARERARLEKQRADRRLRLTVEHAPVGMALVGLDHRFMEPNRRLCEMLGYSPEELTRLTFMDVTHPDDVAMGMKRLEQLVAGTIESIELEKRYVRSDGSLLWGRLSVSMIRDEDGAPVYFVKQVEDITEVREARSELQRRALYDPLTGLANRGLLMDRLRVALASVRNHANVGVAFCDLDFFKSINDTHGHGAGDEVLQVVAQRLEQSVRAEDTVARLGGDEFVILLQELSSVEEAVAVMDRASRSVKDPIVVDGITVHTSLSGGLALAAPGSDPDVLLRDADRALYAAKDAGRGRVEVHGSPRRPAPPAAVG